jgi:hypothetical protein
MRPVTDAFAASGTNSTIAYWTEQLLRHALYGGYPAYPLDRTEASLN